MSKLIPMDEAARILGMSADEVAELRSDNEIFGYRDGSTWKFKMSEIERVADERGITLNVGDAADGLDAVKGKIDEAVSELGLSLEDSDDNLSLQEPDSVEYMEDSSVELFSSPLGGDAASASGSISVSDSSIKIDDLKLLDDDDDEDSLKLSDSIKGAVPQGADDRIDLSGSSIFDGDDALSFGSSSLKLAGDAKGADTGDLLDDEPIGGASGSGTGKDIGAGGGGDDLLLEDEDELALQDSVSFEDSADLSSDFEPSGDLRLDDSDSNIDLVLESNDQGINLAASESGISLSSDEPLELGGSDIDALQLGDDDDDMIVVEEMSGPDDPTLMQEDDFNLTPLEEGAAGADGSTSQVIAMEDSGVFADESAPTVLGDGDFDAVPDDDGLDDGFGGEAMGGLDDGLYDDAALAGGAAAVAAQPDISYTNWQLASLGLVATMLMAGSLVAYDLARNIWMPENQTIGRGVLKFFLGLVNMD